ncbi:MAG: hypothetical protein ABIH23_02555 [bacterium]
MNKTHIFIAIFVFAGVGFVLSASAQVTAVRTLPGEMYLPSDPLTITIEVTGDPGAIIVVETPPAEWSIRASSGGKLSDGVITWNLESFNGSTTLRYYATPPRTATDEALFSGVVGDQEISGMSRMAQYEMPADLRLPQTTGPYEIGTVLVRLIDESRGEARTSDDPNDKRELMVQIWYPADVPESQSPGLVCPDFEAVRSFFEAGLPVGSRFWDCMEAFLGNAVWDAPVLNKGLLYPVLIFSHGSTAFRWQNVSLFEELASHGYVIASIDHTYSAIAVHFPDGRVIPSRGAGQLAVLVQDVRFVLDQLGAMDWGHDFDSLNEVLDFERVGVFGMSHGGTVTTLTMQDDARFKAGVVLDMSLGASKLDQPVMFLHDGISPGGRLESALGGGGYDCKIRGTAHHDFSVGPLLWRLSLMPGKWPISSDTDDPVRVSRIIADYTLAFFDKILKGQRVPLLDGPSPNYPEVEFTIYGEPQGLSGISFEEWTLY